MRLLEDAADPARDGALAVGRRDGAGRQRPVVLAGAGDELASANASATRAEAAIQPDGRRRDFGIVRSTHRFSTLWAQSRARACTVIKC